MIVTDIFSLMIEVLELAPRSQAGTELAAHNLGLLMGIQKYENFTFPSHRGKEAGTAVAREKNCVILSFELASSWQRITAAVAAAVVTAVRVRLFASHLRTWSPRESLTHRMLWGMSA